MKILYVVPFVPWPVKVRSFNLIPRIARNHEIHLVSVSSGEPTEAQSNWLASNCDTVTHVKHSKWGARAQCALALPTTTPMRIAYCRSRTAQIAVSELYSRVQPDIVYVERWRALAFLPRKLEVPLICDPTDSMTLYNRRLRSAGAMWEKLLAWEEHLKFQRYEGELARKADVTVFCSRLDLECVKEKAPDAEYEIVPNGVDTKEFSFKEEREEEPGTIVFTGSFNYRPNCYAVEFFVDQIFPLVRREVPQARFVAVGNGAERALARYRHQPGFELRDFVPALRPYLAKAQVAVVPITVGAGVSNKVAEGFAVGTAVVATPLACGDLPLEDGKHLLIARDGREFANHTVRLLKDAALRRRIALSARRFVEAEYDWEIVSKRMESLMCRLVQGRAEKGEASACATA